MNPSQSSLYNSWLELAQQFLNSTPSSYAKHCLFLVFEGAEGQDNKACTVSWVKVNQYLPDNRYKPEYQSWKMFNNWNYDIITLICILPFVFSSLKYVSDFDLLVFAHWAFISQWALLSCESSCEWSTLEQVTHAAQVTLLPGKKWTTIIGLLTLKFPR